jgi:hypothetical protein
MEKEYLIGQKESEKTEQYVLYEEIGKCFMASVHRALCLKFNEIVAIKIFDYEHHKYGLVSNLIFHFSANSYYDAKKNFKKNVKQEKFYISSMMYLMCNISFVNKFKL